MKKSFLLLSSCILAVSSTQVLAETAKKTKHEHHNKRMAQIAAPASTAATDPSIIPGKQDNAPVQPLNEKIWIDNLSGYLTVTSNYMFRGISQTRNLPALQGSLSYQLPLGIYLNMWGSNVRFEDTPATVELDSVIGVRNTIGEDFTYDVSAARYNYPGARLLNYNEINSVFNYRFIQLGYSYSGNVYNTHGTGQYYQGGINYGIPAAYIFNIQEVTLVALLGHYSLPKVAGNSYNDYNVMLSKAIKNYTFALQWTSTNGRAKSSPYDGSTWMGQVTANF